MPSKFYKCISAALLFLGAFSTSQSAISGPIGPGEFGGNETIETFDSLAAVSGTIPDPLIVNSNTYTTSSGFIRLFTPASGGSVECLGGTGSCIGTGLEDLETITVTLGTPVLRAGLWAGINSQTGLTATVSFFDQSNSLLGSVLLSGDQLLFAGWQADTGLIARIEVADTALNNLVTAIDNVTTETPQATVPPPPTMVPEPATLTIFSLGLAGLGYMRRRRRCARRRPYQGPRGT